MGWKLKSQNDDMAILVKRGWGSWQGHFIICIFLGIWLLFIPNIAYALHTHFFGGSEIIIRVDD
jgi:hypothetical protein